MGPKMGYHPQQDEEFIFFGFIHNNNSGVLLPFIFTTY
jgi:hypothetical protein